MRSYVSKNQDEERLRYKQVYSDNSESIDDYRFMKNENITF